MKKELEDKLFSIHSLLFAQRHLSGSVTRMCDGICIGDGWYDLIDRLCKELQSLSNKTGEQVEFVQIKEKFGGLRAYINENIEESYDETYKIIQKYEEEAYKTCEECGSTEDVTTKGKCWIRTLCSKCYANKQDK